MKKNAIYIVILTLHLALSGCSEKNNQSSNVEKTTDQESSVNKNIADLSIESIDELNEIVEKDIVDTIEDVTKEYEQLQKSIKTYDEYVNNVDKIEQFYNKVKKTHQELCIRMREYSIKYAEKIMALDISNDDKYDELDVLYDKVYDDYGDDIYDEVYDGVLEDMYDFYDDVIGDAYDDVAYKAWSKVSSQEYEWWSDTRSDVYEQWSDYRSDVYEFCSDLRSKIWSDDIDRAKKEIEDFKEDITNLKEKTINIDTNEKDSEKSDTIANTNPSNKQEESKKETSVDQEEQSQENKEEQNVVSSNGIRADFKEAMDAYENFCDEYVAFMKEYKNDATNLELVGKYSEMLKALAEMEDNYSTWEQSDLNTKELQYYIDVQARVSKKMLEAGM